MGEGTSFRSLVSSTLLCCALPSSLKPLLSPGLTVLWPGWWPAHSREPPVSLPPKHQHYGYRFTGSRLTFCGGVDNLNSCPHPHTASALAHWAIASAQLSFLFKGKITDSIFIKNYFWVSIKSFTVGFSCILFVDLYNCFKYFYLLLFIVWQFHTCIILTFDKNSNWKWMFPYHWTVMGKWDAHI